jgi:hypothetical protein
MKKSVFYMILLVLLIGISYGPGCSSFIWDPTGVWSFVYNTTFTEQVTLSGSTEAGVISNWSGDDYDPQTGTWEKTSDFTIYVYIDFISKFATQVTFTVTFTSSQDDPNTMNGTGHFVEDSYEEDFAFQAVKVTNLQ